MNNKFRVWVPVLKSYLFKYIGVDKDGHYTVGVYNNLHTYPYIGKDSYIFQQFTGILDKNGKEIFEGDILREEHDLDKDCMYDDVETYMRNHIVCKVPGYFTHDEDEPCSLILNTYKGVNPYVEVIGNIYENPELIDPNDLV